MMPKQWICKLADPPYKVMKLWEWIFVKLHIRICALCMYSAMLNIILRQKVSTYFPLAQRLTMEGAEQYYDSIQFSDYTHALSKAPIIKAQHPDYEIFKTGIHAQRGVSCADCHMPYVSEGGVKHSSHHIRSPLASMNNTCQVCHRETEEDLRNSL